MLPVHQVLSLHLETLKPLDLLHQTLSPFLHLREFVEDLPLLPQSLLQLLQRSLKPLQVGSSLEMGLMVLLKFLELRLFRG